MPNDDAREPSQGARVELIRDDDARASGAAERLQQAARRDELARIRDLDAKARDERAEREDAGYGRSDATAAELREQIDKLREGAATDRARAAADRVAAATDREEAAGDRAHLRYLLRHAQHDQLTGALGRQLGMLAIEREINRARHSDGRLVLVFVDVDGLKQVNDRDGHSAGDALLRTVVNAIHAQLRSYDPIVRIGGDEFVCALSDTDLDDARRRFMQIRTAIEGAQPDASISTGYAVLGPDDTLEDLTSRSDHDLYTQRSHSRRSA